MADDLELLRVSQLIRFQIIANRFRRCPLLLQMRGLYILCVQSSLSNVDRAELLNGLLRTRSAGLKSQALPACSENTRVGILDELKRWSHDLNGESIYWMYGLAGTGKTTNDVRSMER